MQPQSHPGLWSLNGQLCPRRPRFQRDLPQSGRMTIFEIRKGLQPGLVATFDRLVIDNDYYPDDSSRASPEACQRARPVPSLVKTVFKAPTILSSWGSRARAQSFGVLSVFHETGPTFFDSITPSFRCMGLAGLLACQLGARHFFRFLAALFASAGLLASTRSPALFPDSQPGQRAVKPGSCLYRGAGQLLPRFNYTMRRLRGVCRIFRHTPHYFIFLS